MPRPLRSSCDRCHSQKLKCPKQPGVATCSRCLKAGTPCVFSPAGPSVRRNTATPICLHGGLDMNMNMQFDWPSLDLENPLATPPEVTQELQTGPDQQDSPAAAASQDPRSICVRQLTSMAVEIDRLFQDLSFVSQIHVPKDQPTIDYYAEFINDPRHLCIERLFTHAQCLIDIYPKTLKVLFDTPDLPECQDPDCSHTVELPSELDGFFLSMDDNHNDVDVFLFNILVSCHTKILDVMGLVVDCARACTQVTFSSPDLVEPNVQIPEVRVGNFVATASAAGTMQTALLVHVASVLVDCARRLSKQVTDIVEHEKNTKQVQILKLQCELLEERATSKMKSLERVKGLFTSLGFMR
ncbi:hypothetical protein F5Y13DRAFT_31051 [Hypoxylon sp. FL1857]|nr:hypothetical protein F5Y13DRAFT_31051 [Hypoxylon sp. FL1857]